MNTPLQVRSSVEKEIRAAFRGVTLGPGMSLRRAQFADRFQDGDRKSHRASLAHGEITDDWSQVPLEELERDCIAHLDAEGFRYYIPALMLSILDHYDSSSMRVIGTLGSLYPKKDNTWEYHMNRCSLLNLPQSTAIARFLAALPQLIELSGEDHTIVPRALRNYWGKFLETSAGG